MVSDRSEVTREQQQADRRKRGEARRQERMESGGRTASAEILSIVESIATSAIDHVEDIMGVAREQRAKIRREREAREAQVAPKKV